MLLPLVCMVLCLAQRIEASIEGYYKMMHHIIDFRDNAEFTTNEHIETEVLNGKSRAWGVEAMLRRDGKIGSVLMSYTLSKAERKIDGVNQDKWYYAVYDQRHNLAISGIYKLSNRWTLSGTWRYHTGGRTTMPIDSYFYKFANVAVYTERNGYKMPDFHRLDLSAIYDLSAMKDGDGSRNSYSRSTMPTDTKMPILCLLGQQIMITNSKAICCICINGCQV